MNPPTSVSYRTLMWVLSQSRSVVQMLPLAPPSAPRTNGLAPLAPFLNLIIYGTFAAYEDFAAALPRTLNGFSRQFRA
jgi:hypothetical protein